MAFTPSPQQLLDLKKQNEQRALGNYAYGGNIGASNTGATAFNLSKGQSFSPAPSQNIPQPSQPSQPAAPSIDQKYLDEINNLYSGTNDLLNQRESQARSEAGESERLISQGIDLAQNKSNDLYLQNQKSLENNRTSVDKTARSAMNDALRAYNSLQQQNRSRFGGGSSAHEAVGEIAGAEYFRGQATISEQLVEQMGQIAMKQEQLDTTQKRYKEELELEKQNRLAEVRSQLNNVLAQVSATRVGNEQAKQQARMEVYQQYRQQAQQIDFEMKSRAAQILEGIAQREAENTGRYNGLLAMANAYQAGEFISPAEFSKFGINANNYAPSAVVKRPVSSDDEFSGLSNFFN